MLSKLIQFVKQNQNPIFLGICIVLIAFTSYNLGEINALRKTPVSVSQNEANIFQADLVGQSSSSNSKDAPAPKIIRTDFRVVASKNSNKYHFLWCSGAKKIKETNKLTFATEQEAVSKGYTLAGNCEK